MEQFVIPPLSGEEISLKRVLAAREQRAACQQRLLARHQKPLLCFTMNIAGPVKNNALIRQGFLLGLERLTLRLRRCGIPVLCRETVCEPEGNEAYLVVDTTPEMLKKTACSVEDGFLSGRLYDMDVVFPDTSCPGGIGKLERSALGLEPRCCLVCGKPGKGCASRRLHSVAELQEKTAALLWEDVSGEQTLRIGEYAVRALLFEVAVTPKPGLVDRNNSGSHRDMDFYTFQDSAAALWPYFRLCAETGIRTAAAPAPETFAAIREAGKAAEEQMLRATGGVNTHKGAIFSLGIAAAAAGRLFGSLLRAAAPGESAPSAEVLLRECAAMTAGLTARDFAGITPETARTAGEKLYTKQGITGIRGQLEAGLPAVRDYGLPLLRRLTAAGYSPDAAGRAVLLTLLAHCDDTALIHRGSVEALRSEAARAEALLAAAENGCPERAALEELDAEYIRRNLSPGGSADLLAICRFLQLLESGLFQTE